MAAETARPDTNPGPSLRRRFMSGAVANFVAMAFLQGSTMLSNIILARLLGQAAFGEYAITLNTLLTMSAVAQSAVGFTVAKYVAEFRIIDKPRAGRFLGACLAIAVTLSLTASALLLVAAPVLATTMLNDPKIAQSLMLGSIFLLFSALNGFQLGALAGLEGFRRLAVAGVLSGILAVLCISMGALWFGILGAVGGLGLSAVLRFAIHQVLLSRELREQGVQTIYSGSFRREMPSIVGFALPVAIASYYTVPMMWLANAVLSAQQDGYSQMALFSAAATLKTVVLFVPNSINLVSLSILNNVLGAAVDRNAAKVFLANIVVISLVTIFFASGIYLVSPYLLRMFGDAFADGQVAANFLIGSAVAEGLGMVLLQRLQSAGRGWTILLLVNGPRDLIFILVALWHIPLYGAAGVGLAYLVAYTFSVLIILILVFVSFRRKVS